MNFPFLVDLEIRSMQNLQIIGGTIDWSLDSVLIFATWQRKYLKIYVIYSIIFNLVCKNKYKRINVIKKSHLMQLERPLCMKFSTSVQLIVTCRKRIIWFIQTHIPKHRFLNHIYFDLWVIGVIREVWCFDIKMK